MRDGESEKLTVTGAFVSHSCASRNPVGPASAPVTVSRRQGRRRYPRIRAGLREKAEHVKLKNLALTISEHNG